MAVRKRGDRLVIDFRCYLPDGRRVRCVEHEGKDSKKNRTRVNSKWKAVEYALKHGRFNYLEHFPYGPKAKYFKKQRSGMLFSEWWGIWISGLSIRPATESNYTNQYETHFKKHFGHRPISVIEKHDIMVFRKSLEKDLQPNTINTYIRPLCQCLLEAKRRKLISEYPCEGIGSLQEG